MRVAVIDLGTNTFNLLIADKRTSGGFVKTFSHRVPVKLGEGTINKGFISETPFKRGIDTLKIFSDLIKQKKTDKIIAFATSAIRTAKNGSDFINSAHEQTGIEIQIIDGDREAELIYFGNREAVKMDETISLIMDIGGGSTEFILADKEKIIWKKSFLLGAARLIEKFRPSDPITQNQIKELNNYLKKELVSLFEAVHKNVPIELIGSSGAFDSIVDMMAGEYLTEGLSEKQTEYAVNLPEYLPLSEIIIASTISERKKIKGLIEMRVDMIVISCLLVNFILKELSLSKLRVSTYSLKEGILFNLFNL